MTEPAAAAAAAAAVDSNKKTTIVLDSDQELELVLKMENLERELVIEQLSKAIEEEREAVENLQELLAKAIP